MQFPRPEEIKAFLDLQLFNVKEAAFPKPLLIYQKTQMKSSVNRLTINALKIHQNGYLTN